MAQNHLSKRGNRYIFRRRVPSDLQPVLGKEIKKALKTSDRKTAGRLASIETVNTDELFARKRREVQPVAPPPESRRGVGYAEAILLVSQWYRQLEEDSDEWLEENLAILQNPEELQNALIERHMDEHYFSGGGDFGPGQCYRREIGVQKVKEILTERGGEFAGTETELNRLAGVIRRGLWENARNDLKRLNREPVGDLCFLHGQSDKEQIWTPPLTSQIPQPRVTEYPATVGQILDEFMEEQQLKGRADATLRTYLVPVRFLRETLGEKTLLASVNRDRMKEIWNLIRSLPANAKKFYPNMSLLKTIEAAKKDGKSPIEDKTAENYFRNIQAIFNFAVKIRKIPFSPIDDGLFRTGKRSIRKPRALFRVLELEKLFRSLHHEERQSNPGRFWVPLLALFQGTRLNETCQLYSEDLLEKDGVWCIRIDETRKDGSACEKKLKTSTSRRIIPLHPKLLEIGFLDFVRSRQCASDSPRLFPDLKQAKTRYYSDPFQKWFGRYLERIFDEKPKATFHSFRHMWKDALTEAQVSDVLAKHLGGWSNDRSAASHYGHGPSPKVLLEALQKVTYPGLPLNHLTSE